MTSPLLAALAYLLLGGVFVCAVALVGYALFVGVSDLLHDLEQRRTAGRQGPAAEPDALATDLRRVRRAL